MISPSEFKTLVTLKAYSSGKGAYGGVTKTLQETIDVWGKFEMIGGSTNVTQAQMMSNVTARFTCRYNAAFTANWIVYFDGQYYNISYIKIDDPSYRRFMIMDLSVSLSQTSWS